ncbi:nuclear transport factor 2 family protein [Sphingomonas naphthae]|uniref:Nuclear transport factor 2 family protein n=1 Tax=Sphingomonas naphthae TaxID=1813468 RepID=A0ABY7TH48_9SPHN|nr:nuclear transport factor 2 family protein [Sphingomonas naphthae]WCT72188.1 nuclear transport factor 2 family protein [Sphingomonas naphthae]
MTADATTSAQETLRRWNRAIRAKELDGLRAMMTDDVVIELPFNESGRTEQGFFRVYRGRDACVDFWREAFAQEGRVNRSTEIETSVTADGARIFVEFQGDVTMQSGRAYRNRYVMRFDLVDGRISRLREYYNPIQSAYAFGRPVAGRFHIDAL